MSPLPRACIRVCCLDNLIKDRIVPKEVEESNWCELYILRDACFCMVFKSGIVGWDEGLGRLCCQLDIMGRLFCFLAGGSKLEESSVRDFRGRLADIVS